jgi:hypothetical protein
MAADDPIPSVVTKEFVDREIGHLKELMKEKFDSRDRAIELLASKIPLIVSIIGMLMGAYAIFRGPR